MNRPASGCSTNGSTNGTEQNGVGNNPTNPTGSRFPAVPGSSRERLAPLPKNPTATPAGGQG
ncbi:MAG: hypothetical protein ACK52I_16515 [Pseudomonadota bacterium]|jgi:hypothetical protein